MKRIDIEYETQPIINKSKNLEKITHDLFVDWSILPKNKAVNGTYFDCSTLFPFNDGLFEKGNKK